MFFQTTSHRYSGQFTHASLHKLEARLARSQAGGEKLMEAVVGRMLAGVKIHGEKIYPNLARSGWELSHYIATG